MGGRTKSKKKKPGNGLDEELNKFFTKEEEKSMKMKEEFMTKAQHEYSKSQNRKADKQLADLAETFGGKENVPKELRDVFTNQKKLEEESAKELCMRGLLDHCFQTESRVDPYGDGDQTMMYGDDAQKMQLKWGGGFNYNPNTDDSLSDFCKALFFARVDEAKILIAKAKTASEEELTKLLDRRESMIRFGGVLHILAGCRQEKSNRHVKLMRILLEAGADPNIKDVAGYSALHHCFTCYGNSKTLECAKLLVEYGAEVNAVNRFGCTALMEPCINANFDAIEFLIENGANPCIKENAGLSCETFAAKNPKIQRIFSRGLRTLAKKDQEKQKSTSTVATASCTCCGDLEDLKKCMACLTVSYCSKECQKAHWNAHKPGCKKKAIETKLVVVRPIDQELASNMSESEYSLKHKKRLVNENMFTELKKPFKLKVQVS